MRLHVCEEAMLLDLSQRQALLRVALQNLEQKKGISNDEQYETRVTYGENKVQRERILNILRNTEDGQK